MKAKIKKRKQYKTEKDFVKEINNFDELIPIVELDSDCIYANYYFDRSGSIIIYDEFGGETFFKNDGKLEHHIKYIEDNLKAIIKTHKLAISKLKKISKEKFEK